MTIAADFRLGTKPAAAVTEEVIPGLVWGVRCSGADVRPVDERIDPPGPGEWIWLHFNLADVRAQKWLADCTLVARPGLERLLSKDDAQQLVPSGDCVAGVFFDLVHDFDRATEDFGLVRFVVSRPGPDHRAPAGPEFGGGGPPAYRGRPSLRLAGGSGDSDRRADRDHHRRDGRGTRDRDRFDRGHDPQGRRPRRSRSPRPRPADHGSRPPAAERASRTVPPGRRRPRPAA